MAFVCCRYPFTPDQPVQEADWEVYLRETAQQIVEQQTPKRQGSELKEAIACEAGSFGCMESKVLAAKLREEWGRSG